MQAIEPHLDMVAAAIQKAVGRGPAIIEPVWSGFSHRTFLARLPESGEAVAVRFPIRDHSACRREQGVMALASAAVPVPEVLFADVDGTRIGRPVLVSRWVTGLALDDALIDADSDVATELGRAVGQVIGRLSQVTLPTPGWFADDATVERREHSLAAGIVAHVHSRLFDTDGGRSLSPAARDRFWSIVSGSVAEITALEPCASLVHGDFAGRNVLVAPGHEGWTVVAVLDWEFALSGPSLLDVGHALRHRRSQPPQFERGVADGLRCEGVILPTEWRRLAWLLDSVSLTGPLARSAGHPDRETVSALIAEVAISPYPWETC